ncbi:MAG: helix-turn-helix domain-containing protein [Terrimicrobiaceae bacterium]
MAKVRFQTFDFNSGLASPAAAIGDIHHHPEVELNYVFRGKITYLHRDGLHVLPPHQLAIFWGSTPHKIVSAEPGSEMAWMTVPLAWVWTWNLPERFTKTLMEGRWWHSPKSTVADRFPIRAWVQEMKGATPLRKRALALELEACFLWMAEYSNLYSGHIPTSAAGPGDRLGHIERMARCMAERFREDLDIAEIAAAARLHPNYAMPLFRRHCGVTIRDYLLQLRLIHAQRLLITTDLKVIDVAFSSGFRSLSSFYEAFLKVVKVTPKAFRTRMQA